MTAIRPSTSTIHTSSISPRPWTKRAGSSPATPNVANVPLSQSLNEASSGTLRVIYSPGYPPTVISSGADGLRDRWFANAAASSSTVVAGVSGLVLDQLQGSP
jgi:hypothetical protein